HVKLRHVLRLRRSEEIRGRFRLALLGTARRIAEPQRNTVLAEAYYFVLALPRNTFVVLAVIQNEQLIRVADSALLRAGAGPDLSAPLFAALGKDVVEPAVRVAALGIEDDAAPAERAHEEAARLEAAETRLT